MTDKRPNKLAQQLAKVTKTGGTAAKNAARPAAHRTQGASTSSTDQERPEPRRRPRPAGGRKPPPGQAWDDRVKRATFYVDRELLNTLDECCDRNGLNKSEFVREAITRHLQTYR